jgi:hypothetical protein
MGGSCDAAPRGKTTVETTTLMHFVYYITKLRGKQHSPHAERFQQGALESSWGFHSGTAPRRADREKIRTGAGRFPRVTEFGPAHY